MMKSGDIRMRKKNINKTIEQLIAAMKIRFQNDENEYKTSNFLAKKMMNYIYVMRGTQVLQMLDNQCDLWPHYMA